MALLRLVWTKKGEEVWLAQVRKSHDDSGNKLPKAPGEVEYANSKGEVVEYRKKIKPQLTGFQLNKVKPFTFEARDGNKANTKFSLIVTKNEKVHIIDLGGGMVAKSVVNSLCSMINTPADELASSLFSLSVYVNKKGYNSAMLKRNDEMVPWAFTNEEAESLIERTKNSKGEVVDTDDSAYVEKLKAYVEELNKLLPKTQYQDGTDGFDDLDDTTPPSVTEEDADELFGEARIHPSPKDSPSPEGLPKAPATPVSPTQDIEL